VPETVDVQLAWQRDTLELCNAVRFGTVISYSDLPPGPPRARVQLAQRGGDAAGAKTLPPALPAVPVLWPSWGPIRLRGQLAAGDEVVLLVADRAIDRMLTQGVAGELDSDRVHHIHDAIALPYAWSDAALLARAGNLTTLQLGRPDGTQGLELSIDGTSIRLDAAALVRLGTLAGATHPAVLGDDLVTALAAFAATLTTSTDPAVISAATTLQTLLATTPPLSAKVLIQ
jgi:protein gp138